MAIGFIFPGQGSQEPGMGKDLYDSIPKAKSILDQAAEIMDFDIPVCQNTFQIPPCEK